MNNRIKKDFFSPILVRYRSKKKNGSKYSSPKSLIFLKLFKGREKIEDRGKSFIDLVPIESVIKFHVSLIIIVISEIF